MRHVTFVVGAGASAEFNLPVGSELVKEIASALSFDIDEFGSVRSYADEILFKAIRQSLGQEKSNSAYSAASSIRKNMGLAPSIDNFLEARKSDLNLIEVGKLAIARTLLRAEKRSTLAFDETNHYNRLEFSTMQENWLKVLFRILVEGRDYRGFLECLSRLSFVVFNYDRVIERFLFLATESYFEVESAKVADDLKSRLNIVHPYGVLGSLQSQVIGSGFGRADDPFSLTHSANQLRTFSEGVADGTVKAMISDFIAKSEAVFFLGFAFHPINVKLLETRYHVVSRFLGTVHGISESNCAIISRELKGCLHTTVEPEFWPVHARQLVSDFSAYIGGR